MSFYDKLSHVEINREDHHSLKNTVKIDGKIVPGIRNVKVEYGINTALPVVTIEFYAKVDVVLPNAQVKGIEVEEEKA